MKITNSLIHNIVLQPLITAISVTLLTTTVASFTACDPSLFTNRNKEVTKASKQMPQSETTEQPLNHSPNQLQVQSKIFIPVSNIQFNKAVIDKANLLTDAENQQITKKILSIYQDRKLAQAGLVIVPTTGSESIFDYGMAIAKKWQLGSKDKNDGLLIVLAVEDKNIRIFTGYGLAKPLPDESVAQIISNNVLPHFKQGNYTHGIMAGLDEIESQLEQHRELIGEI